MEQLRGMRSVAADKTTTLRKLATLVRYYILTMTTQAGSGHPTSSLSATELMVGLLFAGAFHYQVKDPKHPNNDRLIFSKGHASPLLYALWAAAGVLDESDLAAYRQFGSRLEGHPTALFPYADAATGSLGQGLSIGVGMALNAKYLRPAAVPDLRAARGQRDGGRLAMGSDADRRALQTG